MSCIVTLSVRADSTAWGETVGLAGSIPQLSTWGATAPPSLAASPFPIWTITLTVPAETTIQYKYVILSSSQIVRWEVLPSGDENRSFTTPADGETLTIDDGCMGDATRTSTTVTPSTTPTTTPTRPQKQLDSTTNLSDMSELTHSDTQTNTQPTGLSVADLTAELDKSRRQLEHIRATVRRIRHIPTPDALSTPPGTPDQSARLSHDAAAALASSTLSEATADVDLIREKLRAVKSAKSESVASSPNRVMLVGMLSFGIALLAIGIVLIDPHTALHMGRIVRTSGDKLLEYAVMARRNAIAFRETAWETAKCWSADHRQKVEEELLESGGNVAHVLERARLRIVLDWLAALARVRTVVREGAIERMRRITARIAELREGR